MRKLWKLIKRILGWLMPEGVSMNTTESHVESNNFSPVTVPGEKYALLVGINKYMDPTHNLRGCIADVENVYGMLTRDYKFDPDNIRVLTDERATKDAILHRLEIMVRGLLPGDLMVFHYSGHGTQVRDRDGDELDDHLDEVICSYDHDWDDPLLDDYIRDIFKLIPKGALVVFFADCCHSGTIDRQFGHDIEWSPRFMPPPFDIAMRSAGRNLPVRIFGEGFIGGPYNMGIAYRDQNHILLSGCRDDQTSADAFLYGRFQGAMTAHLVETILENKNKSWEDVYHIVVEKLKGKRFSQVPQLIGSKHILKGPLFSPCGGSLGKE